MSSQNKNDFPTPVILGEFLYSPFKAQRRFARDQVFSLITSIDNSRKVSVSIPWNVMDALKPGEDSGLKECGCSPTEPNMKKDLELIMMPIHTENLMCIQFVAKGALSAQYQRDS